MVDRRTRADLDADAELVGDDVRERRLAETRRATEQDVLDRLVPAPRGLQEDAEVVAHLLLADIVVEQARSERQVELVVVRARVEDLVLAHLVPSAFNAVDSASWLDGQDFQS